MPPGLACEPVLGEVNVDGPSRARQQDTSPSSGAGSVDVPRGTSTGLRALLGGPGQASWPGRTRLKVR